MTLSASKEPGSKSPKREPNRAPKRSASSIGAILADARRNSTTQDGSVSPSHPHTAQGIIPSGRPSTGISSNRASNGSVWWGSQGSSQMRGQSVGSNAPRYQMKTPPSSPPLAGLASDSVPMLGSDSVVVQGTAALNVFPGCSSGVPQNSGGGVSSAQQSSTAVSQPGRTIPQLSTGQTTKPPSSNNSISNTRVRPSLEQAVQLRSSLIQSKAGKRLTKPGPIASLGGADPRFTVDSRLTTDGQNNRLITDSGSVDRFMTGEFSSGGTKDGPRDGISGGPPAGSLGAARGSHKGPPRIENAGGNTNVILDPNEILFTPVRRRPKQSKGGTPSTKLVHARSHRSRQSALYSKSDGHRHSREGPHKSASAPRPSGNQQLSSNARGYQQLTSSTHGDRQVDLEVAPPQQNQQQHQRSQEQSQETQQPHQLHRQFHQHFQEGHQHLQEGHQYFQEGHQQFQQGHQQPEYSAYANRQGPEELLVASSENSSGPAGYDPSTRSKSDLFTACMSIGGPQNLSVGSHGQQMAAGGAQMSVGSHPGQHRSARGSVLLGAFQGSMDHAESHGQDGRVGGLENHSLSFGQFVFSGDGKSLGRNSKGTFSLPPSFSNPGMNPNLPANFSNPNLVGVSFNNPNQGWFFGQQHMAGVIPGPGGLDQLFVGAFPNQDQSFPNPAIDDAEISGQQHSAAPSHGFPSHGDPPTGTGNISAGAGRSAKGGENSVGAVQRNTGSDLIPKDTVSQAGGKRSTGSPLEAGQFSSGKDISDASGIVSTDRARSFVDDHFKMTSPTKSVRDFQKLLPPLDSNGNTSLPNGNTRLSENEKNKDAADPFAEQKSGRFRLLNHDSSVSNKPSLFSQQLLQDGCDGFHQTDAIGAGHSLDYTSSLENHRRHLSTSNWSHLEPGRETTIPERRTDKDGCPINMTSADSMLFSNNTVANGNMVPNGNMGPNDSDNSRMPGHDTNDLLGALATSVDQYLATMNLATMTVNPGPPPMSTENKQTENRFAKTHQAEGRRTDGRAETTRKDLSPSSNTQRMLDEASTIRKPFENASLKTSRGSGQDPDNSVSRMTGVDLDVKESGRSNQNSIATRDLLGRSSTELHGKRDTSALGDKHCSLDDAPVGSARSNQRQQYETNQRQQQVPNEESRKIIAGSRENLEPTRGNDFSGTRSERTRTVSREAILFIGEFKRQMQGCRDYNMLASVKRGNRKAGYLVAKRNSSQSQNQTGRALGIFETASDSDLVIVAKKKSRRSMMIRTASLILPEKSRRRPGDKRLDDKRGQVSLGDSTYPFVTRKRFPLKTSNLSSGPSWDPNLSGGTSGGAKVSDWTSAGLSLSSGSRKMRFDQGEEMGRPLTDARTSVGDPDYSSQGSVQGNSELVVHGSIKDGGITEMKTSNNDKSRDYGMRAMRGEESNRMVAGSEEFEISLDAARRHSFGDIYSPSVDNSGRKRIVNGIENGMIGLRAHAFSAGNLTGRDSVTALSRKSDRNSRRASQLVGASTWETAEEELKRMAAERKAPGRHTLQIDGVTEDLPFIAASQTNASQQSSQRVPLQDANTTQINRNTAQEDNGFVLVQLNIPASEVRLELPLGDRVNDAPELSLCGSSQPDHASLIPTDSNAVSPNNLLDHSDLFDNSFFSGASFPTGIVYRAEGEVSVDYQREFHSIPETFSPVNQGSEVISESNNDIERPKIAIHQTEELVESPCMPREISITPISESCHSGLSNTFVKTPYDPNERFMPLRHLHMVGEKSIEGQEREPLLSATGDRVTWDKTPARDLDTWDETPDNGNATPLWNTAFPELEQQLSPITANVDRQKIASPGVGNEISDGQVPAREAVNDELDIQDPVLMQSSENRYTVKKDQQVEPVEALSIRQSTHDVVYGRSSHRDDILHPDGTSASKYGAFRSGSQSSPSVSDDLPVVRSQSSSLSKGLSSSSVTSQIDSGNCSTSGSEITRFSSQMEMEMVGMVENRERNVPWDKYFGLGGDATNMEYNSTYRPDPKRLWRLFGKPFHWCTLKFEDEKLENIWQSEVWEEKKVWWNVIIGVQFLLYIMPYIYSFVVVPYRTRKIYALDDDEDLSPYFTLAGCMAAGALVALPVFIIYVILVKFVLYHFMDGDTAERAHCCGRRKDRTTSNPTGRDANEGVYNNKGNASCDWCCPRVQNRSRRNRLPKSGGETRLSYNPDFEKIGSIARKRTGEYTDLEAAESESENDKEKARRYVCCSRRWWSRLGQCIFCTDNGFIRRYFSSSQAIFAIIVLIGMHIVSMYTFYYLDRSCKLMIHEVTGEYIRHRYMFGHQLKQYVPDAVNNGEYSAYWMSDDKKELFMKQQLAAFNKWVPHQSTDFGRLSTHATHCQRTVSVIWLEFCFLGFLFLLNRVSSIAVFITSGFAFILSFYEFVASRLLVSHLYSTTNLDDFLRNQIIPSFPCGISKELHEYLKQTGQPCSAPIGDPGFLTTKIDAQGHKCITSGPDFSFSTCRNLNDVPTSEIPLPNAPYYIFLIYQKMALEHFGHLGFFLLRWIVISSCVLLQYFGERKARQEWCVMFGVHMDRFYATKVTDKIMDPYILKRCAEKIRQNMEPTYVRAHTNVSIIFADISNFTLFSSSVEMVVFIKILNQIFSTLDEMASRYGVTKIKTIGDEYMAGAGLFIDDDELVPRELVEEAPPRGGAPQAVDQGGLASQAPGQDVLQDGLTLSNRHEDGSLMKSKREHGSSTLNRTISEEERQVRERKKKEGNACACAMFGIGAIHGFKRQIRSALHNYHMLEHLQRTGKTQYIDAMELKVGMHSGAVYAGILSVEALSYDVWGPTVNMASRIESFSKPGSLLTTTESMELISKYFECERMEEGPLAIKGFAEKREAYWVRGIKTSVRREFVGNYDNRRLVGFAERDLDNSRELYETESMKSGMFSDNEEEEIPDVAADPVLRAAEIRQMNLDKQKTKPNKNDMSNQNSVANTPVNQNSREPANVPSYASEFPTATSQMNNSIKHLNFRNSVVPSAAPICVATTFEYRPMVVDPALKNEILNSPFLHTLKAIEDVMVNKGITWQELLRLYDTTSCHKMKEQANPFATFLGEIPAGLRLPEGLQDVGQQADAEEKDDADRQVVAKHFQREHIRMYLVARLFMCEKQLDLNLPPSSAEYCRFFFFMEWLANLEWSIAPLVSWQTARDVFENARAEAQRDILQDQRVNSDGATNTPGKRPGEAINTAEVTVSEAINFATVRDQNTTDGLGEVVEKTSGETANTVGEVGILGEAGTVPAGNSQAAAAEDSQTVATDGCAANSETAAAPTDTPQAEEARMMAFCIAAVREWLTIKNCSISPLDFMRFAQHRNAQAQIQNDNRELLFTHQLQFLLKVILEQETDVVYDKYIQGWCDIIYSQPINEDGGIIDPNVAGTVHPSVIATSATSSSLNAKGDSRSLATKGREEKVVASTDLPFPSSGLGANLSFSLPTVFSAISEAGDSSLGSISKGISVGPSLDFLNGTSPHLAYPSFVPRKDSPSTSGSGEEYPSQIEKILSNDRSLSNELSEMVDKANGGADAAALEIVSQALNEMAPSGKPTSPKTFSMSFPTNFPSGNHKFADQKLQDQTNSFNKLQDHEREAFQYDNLAPDEQNVLAANLLLALHPSSNLSTGISLANPGTTGGIAIPSPTSIRGAAPPVVGSGLNPGCFAAPTAVPGFPSPKEAGSPSEPSSIFSTPVNVSNRLFSQLLSSVVEENIEVMTQTTEASENRQISIIGANSVIPNQSITGVIPNQFASGGTASNQFDCTTNHIPNSLVGGTYSAEKTRLQSSTDLQTSFSRHFSTQSGSHFPSAPDGPSRMFSAPSSGLFETRIPNLTGDEPQSSLMQSAVTDSSFTKHKSLDYGTSSSSRVSSSGSNKIPNANQPLGARPEHHGRARRAFTDGVGAFADSAVIEQRHEEGNTSTANSRMFIPHRPTIPTPTHDFRRSSCSGGSETGSQLVIDFANWTAKTSPKMGDNITFRSSSASASSTAGGNRSSTNFRGGTNIGGTVWPRDSQRGTSSATSNMFEEFEENIKENTITRYQVNRWEEQVAKEKRVAKAEGSHPASFVTPNRKSSGFSRREPQNTGASRRELQSSITSRREKQERQHPKSAKILYDPKSWGDLPGSRVASSSSKPSNYAKLAHFSKFYSISKASSSRHLGSASSNHEVDEAQINKRVASAKGPPVPPPVKKKKRTHPESALQSALAEIFDDS